MSHMRKLAQFRQLSLGCETPPPQPPSVHRRKSLKKQFSEDLGDVGAAWSEEGLEIKVSLSSKMRNADKTLQPPPPVRLAWADRQQEMGNEDAVIVRKCKEIRRTPSSKLTRHNSLEKDSILHSKQDIADKLRHNHHKEKQKNEKPNLKIFLAPHVITDDETDHNDLYRHVPHYNNDHVTRSGEPKLIEPLTTAYQDHFQIRKNRKHEPRPNFTRSNTIVVVPMQEKDFPHQDEIKPINSVIIRPATAAAKREKFQKRSNEPPFHETLPFRAPLVRSSSAPSKPKFLATKRKVKRTKVPPTGGGDGGEWHDRTDCNEVETMVSLISPSGSDNEENVENGEVEVGGKVEDVEVKKSAKNLLLRKVVKQVSFQQSSIHAIRSFSASFPARRSSVATALMMHKKPSKMHEKRSTNTSSPDSDERVPKRRLVRTNTEEARRSNTSRENSELMTSENPEEEEEIVTNDANLDSSISVDVTSKTAQQEEEDAKEVQVEDKRESGETQIEDEEKHETQKEKQCWDMYCKMTEKGINVSYDTILRGMLTPTEYRMRRKNSREGGPAPPDNC